MVDDPADRKIRTVLILGAGTMGWQLAILFAQHRMKVYLSDLSMDALEKARNQIKSNFDRRVQKSKLSAEKRDEILPLLTYVKDWTVHGKEIDLVIEAVPEILEIKQKIFAQLAKFVTPGTICGSNSSTIGIQRIVIGLPVAFTNFACNIHFSNPPLRLRLVELYSFAQDNKLLGRLKRYFRRMQYEPVVLQKPVSGFIMNRILGAAFLEAFNLLEAGVTTPEDLDTACTAGLNWPLGICRIADLVGIDIILHSMQAASEESGLEYLKPPAYIVNLFQEGKLGWKTGQGIYTYRGSPDENPNAGE